MKRNEYSTIGFTAASPHDMDITISKPENTSTRFMTKSHSTDYGQRKDVTKGDSSFPGGTPYFAPELTICPMCWVSNQKTKT
jgi:hypothetical protein